MTNQTLNIRIYKYFYTMLPRKKGARSLIFGFLKFLILSGFSLITLSTNFYILSRPHLRVIQMKSFSEDT